MKTKISLAVAAVALYGAGPAHATPNNTYYITAASQASIFAVNGATVSQTGWGSVGPEGPIALIGTEVRTLGETPGTKGSGYSGVPGTALTFTGVNYTNTAGAGTVMLDGTSDGSHNYSIDLLTGTVYRFGLDWSSPDPLFTLPGGAVPGWAGITYDWLNNSLWVSAFYGGTIANYDFTGALTAAGSFVGAANLTALAMDSDRTLWLVENAIGNTGTRLYRYSTAGDFLGDEILAETMEDVLGGEIARAAVPEIDSLSGSAALSLVGWALMLAAERRRRSA